MEGKIKQETFDDSIGKDHVLAQLESMNQLWDTNFILVTKHALSSKTVLHWSSGFTHTQIEQIRSYIDNPSACDSITTIRPALNVNYQLVISRSTTEHLIAHYTNLLISVSQAICKEVAKQWIKVAEPNKQALFPYKYCNDSKPPWWPSSVNHIEPDHLDKAGRIKVLINILRSPDFDLHALKSRTSVLSFKNAAIQKILEELYYVSAYDRLFFDQFRERSPLFSSLRDVDKKRFQESRISLSVSDVRYTRGAGKKKGVMMISQIKKDSLNEQVYQLCEGEDQLSESDEYSDGKLISYAKNNRISDSFYPHGFKAKSGGNGHNKRRKVEKELTWDKKDDASDTQEGSVVSSDFSSYSQITYDSEELSQFSSESPFDDSEFLNLENVNLQSVAVSK